METVDIGDRRSVYNEAAHVENLSVIALNQTLEPQRHMVVVLDGGSTDGTRAIVSSIAEAHSGEVGLAGTAAKLMNGGTAKISPLSTVPANVVPR